MQEREATERRLYKESKLSRIITVRADINFIPHHVKLEHEREMRNEAGLSENNEQWSAEDIVPCGSSSDDSELDNLCNGDIDDTVLFAVKSNDSGLQRTSDDVIDDGERDNSSDHIIDDTTLFVTNEGVQQKSCDDVIDDSGQQKSCDYAIIADDEIQKCDEVTDDITPCVTNSSESGIQKSTDDITGGVVACYSAEQVKEIELIVAELRVLIVKLNQKLGVQTDV